MITAADILKAQILIVDDQQANVSLLEQMLQGAGYVAVTATRDPHTVCELHRRHRYDLILLDLQMPGLDGFQVMQSLKEIEPGGDLPVLVITAQPGHKLRALRAGAKDFVSKPFDLVEILVRVHNLLEIRVLHRNEARLNFTRLESSQRIAGLGDWQYDLSDHQLLWSDGVYQILGIARKDFPPDSETFYHQVHPDDLAFVHQEKKAAAEGSRRVDFEHRIIRPNGEVRYIHQVTEMLLDDQGNRIRESGTLQDITERKLGELALRQSEERYRLLFERNPSPMWVFDPRTLEFLAVNEATLALYGYTRGEFLRLSARDIRPPGAIPDFLLRTATAPINFRSAGRYQHQKKDGTVFPVDTLAHGIEFAGRPARLVLAVDMTEPERVSAALRESEERFRFVARAVSDAIWDWNIPANTVWWNEGFLTAFGFIAGELEPSVEAWSSRIHSDDRSRIIESLHLAIDSRAESWSAEYHFRRKDGSYAFVQDRGYILRDATGRGLRMVGGLRDLTEQKKMEAQYLRAQRMESIGTLAGGIAHDLNNVLAPIMMAIELLKVDPANDPRRRKMLDTIYVSCCRGADLVRQVLSFGRGVDVRRTGIRLQNMISELEGIISETFPRNIRIVTEVSNDLWHIIGDATQLHQVLLNLAVNARDAMPHGGLLTLKAANVTIDDQYAGTSQAAKHGLDHRIKAGPHVLLRVTDTGSGIPAEIRERIFEPFFTTKEIGKGTGLGLATVHAIVKNHGGSISVYSEVGRGSTFSVYLPADPAYGTPASEHPFKDNLPLGQNELVLVVDDEVSIREITQQTLQAFGYRVLIARDGAEATALYAKNAGEIALVLTDMMMPVMDGAATIQVLRSINPSVRIIAVSGIEVATNTAQPTGIELCDFLPKPYTAQTLIMLVREVLDRPTPRAVVTDTNSPALLAGHHP